MTLYEGQVVTIGDHIFGLFPLKKDPDFFRVLDENGKEIRKYRAHKHDSEWTVRKAIAEVCGLMDEFEADEEVE